MKAKIIVESINKGDERHIPALSARLKLSLEVRFARSNSETDGPFEIEVGVDSNEPYVQFLSGPRIDEENDSTNNKQPDSKVRNGKKGGITTSKKQKILSGSRTMQKTRKRA